MKKLLKTAIAIGVACVTLNANATALTLDGDWSAFSFGDVGSSWSSSYTFTLTSTANLQVTDAYLSGDQFSVYSNGTLLGNTSLPTTLGSQIYGDFNSAFKDSTWSSGSWTLGPGTYEISGTTLLSPYNGGAAALRLITAAVPEPETYALMGVGLLGLLAAHRKKSK